MDPTTRTSANGLARLRGYVIRQTHGRKGDWRGSSLAARAAGDWAGHRCRTAFASLEPQRSAVVHSVNALALTGRTCVTTSLRASMEYSIIEMGKWGEELVNCSRFVPENVTFRMMSPRERYGCAYGCRIAYYYGHLNPVLVIETF